MRLLLTFMIALSLAAPTLAAEYRYVREKANPLNVLKGGYTQPGGLGAFDDSIYEEVAGQIPQGAVKSEPLNLAQNLEAVFLATMSLNKDKLPADARGQLYILKVAITEALKTDPDAAKALIQGAVIPPELEPIRQQMLNMFPK